MKISEKTLSVWKYLSIVNNSIKVETNSNVIAALSPNRTVYVNAIVEEEFPPFSIYDISKLLGVVKKFKNPEFIFEKDHVQVNSENQILKFKYCDPTLINVPPEPEEGKYGDMISEFNLNYSDISGIIDISNKLDLEDISVVCKPSECIKLELLDNSINDSSNSFIINLDEVSLVEFIGRMNVKSLNLFPGNYNVKLYSSNIAKFQNLEYNIYYLIALVLK